jgi:hypothetical protein
MPTVQPIPAITFFEATSPSPRPLLQHVDRLFFKNPLTLKQPTPKDIYKGHMKIVAI